MKEGPAIETPLITFKHPNLFLFRKKTQNIKKKKKERERERREINTGYNCARGTNLNYTTK